MKVWIVFQQHNDAPNDEYLIEWKDVIKVVDSEEKAKKECKNHWNLLFESYDVE